MKVGRVPHRWAIRPLTAIRHQEVLAARVVQEPMDRPVRLVAGADAAFSRDGRWCIAGVVVWDVRAREVVEARVARAAVRFPYVPGLLSFREAPAVLAAIRRLRSEPDVFLFDAHGVAHPRAFGLACHVGVLIGLPSVGCAKSRLCGEHGGLAERRGSRCALRYRGNRVGTLLRTREGVKPVFVSVGHRVSLRQAEDLVLRCAVGYRLPEPTRLADRLVARVKRGDLETGG